MNPKAVLLIILVAVAVVGLIVWLFWLRAGVRQRDYKRMERERNQALLAVQRIEIEADKYRDIDSPLAANVRQVIRELNSQRMELS